MKLCWADRLAIVATLVVLFLFNMISKQFAPDALLEIAFRVCLPVWVGLRLIDWASGGPGRRKAQGLR